MSTQTVTELQARLAAQQAERDAEEARRAALYANPETIKVGEGVTLRTGLGGLYIPFTVIANNRKGKELVIQQDRTVQVSQGDPYADNGEKTYERDPRGRVETITLRNDGTYIAKGAPKEWYATRYYVGMRREWTDFSQ